MGALWQTIRDALETEQYVISVHAAEQLRRRSIVAWQVVAGTLEGRLLVTHQSVRPNPKVAAEIDLADGTRAKSVWSWNREHALARPVTVHFFER